MEKQQLIRILNECRATCEYCADACLSTNSPEHMVDCIRLDNVCARICEATASVLSVTFSDYDDLVSYCARICEQCAEECAQHEHDHCQLCARNCLACAAACKNLLGIV